MTRAWVIFLAVAIVLISSAARAAEGGAPPCPADDDACAILPDASAPAAPRPAPGVLVYFWGVACPVCEEAKPWLDALEAEGVRIERVEVKRDAEGRARFVAEVERLGIEGPGVPTFVFGDDYLVGFQVGVSEERIRRMAAGRGSEDGASLERVVLPLVGAIDPRALPLPAFTVVVGLIDGINPCAMWVLMVLLGILVHVKDRRRMALFGGTFVLMSGVIYFVFMVAWVTFFQLAGMSRILTIGLGAVVALMGLVNLKELFWFKKGFSLVIPDRAKPGLYKRMRGITRAASLPAAMAGIVALAFVVNLIELGCTLGLPAVYTRILSLRAELTPASRYAYLVLYNLAYVVPLALIVAVYALTLHRAALSERGAKILKGVSGVLLLSFGLVLMIAPELLH